jgi:2-polyprenyl-3-methyl-5-hydroxy-6-metoxy-1,4-benzoquinol methylase
VSPDSREPATPKSDEGQRVDADHYSYRVYADPAMAEHFDGARFGGAIGGLLAETQERVMVRFLGDLSGQTILDVGTGTGRAALALSRMGARVTGVDASAEMLRVAKERAAAAGLSTRFEVGDAHALAFPERSFDSAVSLRVLMHTPDWRRCVGELCRVARHRVVFDYPAAVSAAALQAAARRVMAAMGQSVEAYRVLRHSAVRAAVEANGFRIIESHRQFVLPIALHKMAGSRRLTEGVERGLAAVGLLRLFGSPVTVVAERCASS